MIARFAAVRLVLMLLVVNGASAQSQPAGPSQTLPTIDVFAPTPLAGSVIDVEKVPANVTVVGSTRIQRAQSLNVTDALQQWVPGMIVTEVAGNPFQPDVQFRGFVASPVAGTPQGLAVYQNGSAHQRSVRRYSELESDSDYGDPVGRRGHQQPRIRP